MTNEEQRQRDPQAGFANAMAHLYRGEMHRMTVWRQRLDVTTNWAILLSVALTTFVLGDEDSPHFIMLLGLALVGVSIVLESRRYRRLHHSNWRLQLMERGYFAAILRGAESDEQEEWRTALAEELENPRLRLGWLMAARVRLRRNYLLVSYFITAAWLTKLFIHPRSPASFAEFYGRLAVGGLIPPWVVALSATTFVVGATVIAVTCRRSDPMTDDPAGCAPLDV